ncbi:hypothetical protein EG327_003323 [Venturia inaequalis]|uniref:DUF7587 domain-containing protein n=1 Tax=Venturia inaequalis TaxID=5025 RepID=A0A8H3ZCQ6_VENIN|nr:hypothetical protein EG327_003323 [Venturia inaequalis]
MYLSSRPNHERPPADGFWRVQDDQSFTHYDEQDGFVANGRYHSYWMSDWFNAKTVNNHLDWAARPKEKTPFISVFDNFDEAAQRATVHRNHRGRGNNVFLAKIDTANLEERIWNIRFSNEVVRLPVWESDEVVFISTNAIKTHIGGVAPGIGQRSEWFALHHIPASLITIA